MFRQSSKITEGYTELFKSSKITSTSDVTVWFTFPSSEIPVLVLRRVLRWIIVMSGSELKNTS